MGKCRAAVQCPYPGCQYKHHQLLHRENHPAATTTQVPATASGNERPTDAFIGVAKSPAQSTWWCE